MPVLNPKPAKARFYETKLINSAFVCEFFAGVASTSYALKRDLIDNRRGL